MTGTAPTAASGISLLGPETVVAEHIAAVNAFDEDAIVATLAEDALVNDAHREFWGTEVRNSKIVSLIVIRNTSAGY